jgi:hypothetical protein
MEQVDKAKAVIIVPMPALAEFLVGADLAAVDAMQKLERKTYVLPAPFDRMAAFECAQLDRAALGGATFGRKAGTATSKVDANGSAAKKDGVSEPWQKIKIDRQIVAIAKANGARLIISEDAGVRGNALRVGIATRTIGELELPAEARQGKLELVVVSGKRSPRRKG